MKNIIKTLTLLSLTLFSAISNASIENVYSEKGYPYKDLIERTEQVKIIYSENSANVTCRVEITGANAQWQSQAKTVSQHEFAQAPLASCLSRADAKQQLAKTYAS